MRVLIAGGDRDMLSLLKRALTDDGYTVDVALNGEHALWHGTEFDYDAVLLDEMLPVLDGVEVAIRLRARKSTMPILMFISPDEFGNHQPRSGTDAADIEVIKPIELEALSAQLRTLTSVSEDSGPRQLRVGDLRLNPATREAWRTDSELRLSPREYTLLQLFLAHPGQVLTRRQILDHVWSGSRGSSANLVDQYVLYLRRKVDRPFGIQQLETVRGAGYRLRERPSEDPDHTGSADTDNARDGMRHARHTRRPD